MPLYEVDLCRVYFNAAGDPSKLWSIDFGEGTKEMQVADVAMVDVTGWTGTNLAADNVRKPRAWIHLRRVTIDVDEVKASAVIRRRRW
jgi:hypothetical protein